MLFLCVVFALLAGISTDTEAKPKKKQQAVQVKKKRPLDDKALKQVEKTTLDDKLLQFEPKPNTVVTKWISGVFVKIRTPEPLENAVLDQIAAISLNSSATHTTTKDKLAQLRTELNQMGIVYVSISGSTYTETITIHPTD